MKRGIANSEELVKEAARKVTNAAYNAAQRALDERSPSKKFAEIGMYADLGLVEGLRAYQPTVEREASAVAESLLTSTSPILANLSSLIAEDVDATPTIRPVIDLSNVESGVREMNGMLNADRSMRIGTTTSVSFVRDIAQMQYGSSSAQSDKQFVADAISSIGNRLDRLQDAMTNLKVVLDSGVLVGETSSMMDRQLGTLATRRDRGN